MELIISEAGIMSSLITEGEIVKWLVKEGDVIKEDQTIGQIETDKSVADIPSP